jgi:DNA polymerase-3 subunit epsilon
MRDGPTLKSELELEALRAELEHTGDYRVLRKLRTPSAIDPPALARTGLFIDVETTGLDPARHEIIELAMVPFFYLPDGDIVGVGEPFSGLRQPASPIPPAITALTGIDDGMVAGQVIDPDAVAAFVSSASLVVAHNAGFDRRFVERFSDVFTTKPWACSMAEVPWVAEGAETVKLAYLAMERGFFYDGHRALNDCYAAIELLSQPLPRTGEIALSKLLDSARRPLWRIWAENSPFDLKDRLKERGYRWNVDPGPAPRAWFVDVADESKDAELGFLQVEIYGREIELLTRRITAYDRYSDRC